MNALLVRELLFRRRIKKCDNPVLKEYLQSIDKDDAIKIFSALNKLHFNFSDQAINNFKNHPSYYNIEIFNILLNNAFKNSDSRLIIFNVREMYRYDFKNIKELLYLLIYYSEKYKLTEIFDTLVHYRSEQEIRELFDFYTMNVTYYNELNLKMGLSSKLFLSTLTHEQHMRLLRCLRVFYDIDDTLFRDIFMNLHHSKKRTPEEIIETIELYTINCHKRKNITKNVLDVYYGKQMLYYYTFYEHRRLIEFLHDNKNDNEVARLILAVPYLYGLDNKRSIDDIIKLLNYYRVSEKRDELLSLTKKSYFGFKTYLTIEEDIEIIDTILNSVNPLTAQKIAYMSFYSEVYTKDEIIFYINEFNALNYNENILDIFMNNYIYKYRKMGAIFELLKFLKEYNYNPSVLLLIKDRNLLTIPYEEQVLMIQKLRQLDFNLESLKRRSIDLLIEDEREQQRVQDKKINFEPVKPTLK